MGRYFYGIDLGTTNSVIAVYDAILDTVTAMDYWGNTLMKSQIYSKVNSDEVGIGEFPSAENVIKNVKSSIGDNPQFSLGDKQFSAVEVSSKILAKMISVAKDKGHEVDEVTITVPAKFNHQERMNTLRAAELAGIKVIGLINEPTAASLSYLEKIQGEETVLVYDLGGGTFDVSVVTVMGSVPKVDIDFLDIHIPEIDKKLVTVKDSDGDIRLGGNDLDELVLKFILEDYSITELSEQDLKKLKRLIISIKESDKGDLIQLNDTTFRIGTDYIEEATRVIFDRTMAIMNRVLMRNSISSIARIVLVGGSTKNKYLQNMLTKTFPKTNIYKNINPDECVAIGAAKNSYILRSDQSKLHLTDIVNENFGIEVTTTEGGKIFEKMIYKSSPIPTFKLKQFAITDKEGSEDLKVDIYQGEFNDCSMNTKIGTITIGEEFKDTEEVICKFEITTSGVLKVSLMLKDKDYLLEIDTKDIKTKEIDEDLRALLELTNEF